MAAAACPDGRCDGSGFLYDEASAPRAAVLVPPAAARAQEGRGRPGRLPKRFREVSFDREPVAVDRAPRPDVVRDGAPLRPHDRRAARRGPRAVVHRRRRHRQDDARDARLQGRDGGRPHGRDLLAAAAAGHAARAPTTTTRVYSLNELIDRLCAVDLLHIDDVGAEQTSPWVLEQLYTIVNTRYEDGRAVMLTTNLARRRSCATQIGDRTVSRLNEMCTRAAAARRGPARGQRLPAARAGARAGAARAAGAATRTAPGRTRTPTSRPPTAARGAPPRLRHGYGRHRDRGRPVGRRGQGQDRRPARGARGPRDPLPGRQQRRPHDRPRRRQVEVPPDPERDPLPGPEVRDRQRRRDRPEGPHGRAGRPAREGRSTSPACGSAPTRT